MMLLATRRWATMIARLSPVRAVAPGCMAGYLWPSPARRPLEPKNFPLPHHPASGAPIGIPRARAFGAKIHGSGRGAALRLPSARVSRAPALFRLPGHYGKAHRNGAQPHGWRKTMRTSPNSPSSVGSEPSKQVGKTVRVSICANYPFKDDKGQWKEDAHWNEVTIFTK